MTRDTRKDDEGREDQPDATGASRVKRMDYEERLCELHVKLVDLQEWVRHRSKKICIVFEGRDGAGKGGAIKAITARVSPRVFRVVALPAPTERNRREHRPLGVPRARAEAALGQRSAHVQALSGLRDSLDYGRLPHFRPRSRSQELHRA